MPARSRARAGSSRRRPGGSPRRQPAVAGADGRLRDADARGDGAERLAAVRLQRLDDLRSRSSRPPCRRNGAALRPARWEAEAAGRPRLRIARDSYHSAAHFASRTARDRSFCAALDDRRRCAYAASVRFLGERRSNNEACVCCLLGLPDLAPDAPSRDAYGVPILAKEFCVAWIRPTRARLERRARRKLEPGLVPGRVAAAHRGAFDVWTADGAVRSRLPGRLLHEASTSASATGSGLGDGLIRTVLPRRSAIVRNAAGLTTTAQTLAANVDVAFVVSLARARPRAAPHRALSRHDLGERRDARDRAHEGRPARGSRGSSSPRSRQSRSASRCMSSRAVTGQGCDALRARIAPGTTAVLLGSSGVGKSTLVNRWLGEEVMATKRDARGRRRGPPHDDARQLLVLPGGGLVIDTPGMRELQLWDVGAAASTRRSRTSRSSRRAAASATARTSTSPAARCSPRSSRASWPASGCRAGGSSSASCARSRCGTTSCSARRKRANGSCGHVRAARGRGIGRAARLRPCCEARCSLRP